MMREDDITYVHCMMGREAHNRYLEISGLVHALPEDGPQAEGHIRHHRHPVLRNEIGSNRKERDLQSKRVKL